MSVQPRHISFVLDGNRRWARAAGLPTLEGHRRGMDNTWNILEWCRASGVEYLTVYAFSTENWNRLPEELDYLFGVVFPQFFKKYTERLVENNIKVNVFGGLEKFPSAMRESVLAMVDKTANNSGLIWNICLDYGGRAEIVRAARSLVSAGVSPDEITEEVFAQRLFSGGMPDPDLLIRTGGDARISNFLLWQHAYTEFYFCPKTLPDFTREDFDQALRWYAERDRRMGR